MNGGDFSDLSMLELFRAELASQSQALTTGLLALERDPGAAAHLEACMRAAHSLKGAARIIDLTAAVKVAHEMEECLVAAQRGAIRLGHTHIDALLKGIDLLTEIASEQAPGEAEAEQRIGDFVRALHQAPEARGAEPSGLAEPRLPETTPGVPEDAITLAVPPELEQAVVAGEAGSRMVRVTAESLNRLLGLAGESLMASRRLRPFNDGLLRLRRVQAELVRSVDALKATMPAATTDPRALQALDAVQLRLQESQAILGQRLDEFDVVDRQATDLASRLYDETLASRMRPFEDGVRHFSRTVRDIGRTLGKKLRLDIIGGATSIDRDILEQLDAPLGHLLRNAVDHGLEGPEERSASGKPAEGTIRLEARHHAGLLQIIVSDDGRGIDLDALRQATVDRGFTTAEAVHDLSEAELLEFLFLPGFSMKATISDISGRGVGLDAVQAMVRQIRGQVEIASRPGRGTPAPRLVAIGASAGGPTAVATLLAGLPRGFPASIILVQHLDAQFVPGFASWLEQQSGLTVRPALEGDQPMPGGVLIAASSDHLVFKSASELGYRAEPRDYAYRPSVDAFFESVAQRWPGEPVGVLLTGMGRDGARGLKLLRDKHHLTIAQDQATSAVYGMPKAAAAIGAAAEILPLTAIAPRLAEVCGQPAR